MKYLVDINQLGRTLRFWDRGNVPIIIFDGRIHNSRQPFTK